jgi:secondary thiamine-phosphate synthase enzyme
MKEAIIAVDGASKGNPGPAGIGVVICDESGTILKKIGQNIGTTTNNFAEYTALIRGLSEALQMGFTDAKIQTDSELMAKQINGQYRVKNESIISLHATARDLMQNFRSVTLTHVLRGKNKEADALASKAAMDGRPVQESLILESPKPVAPKSPAPVPETPEKSAIHRLKIRTSARNELLEITGEVQSAVNASGVSDGVCTVFIPHTTAGVTINENADPDVVRDVIETLNRLVPDGASYYRHSEGNSDAHMKASMMGSSVTVIVERGRLVLGTWQGIYLCEFDGPRNRQVFVRVG